MKRYIIWFLLVVTISLTKTTIAVESSFSSNSISVVNSELKDVKKISNALRKEYDPGEAVDKYIDCGGIYIFAREDVSDYALLEARYLLKNMFELNPSFLRKQFEPIKAFIKVWAIRELAGDIMGLSPGPSRDFWDKRARGFGGKRDCSAGEEGLLCSAGNPYGGERNSLDHLCTQSESIFIHEFGHQIHSNLDKRDSEEVKKAYQDALKNPEAKEFIAKYGMSNELEYFAVCTQIWFEASWHRASLTFLNHPTKPNTTDPFLCRNTLMKVDPNISKVLTKVFGLTKWRFTDPRTRYNKSHFIGYDPTKSLPFTFDRKTVDEYNINYAKERSSKKVFTQDTSSTIFSKANATSENKHSKQLEQQNLLKSKIVPIQKPQSSFVERTNNLNEQVSITKKVIVSIYLSGKVKGNVTLREGYKLNVIKVKEMNIVAKFGESEIIVPIVNTNYRDSVVTAEIQPQLALNN